MKNASCKIFLFVYAIVVLFAFHSLKAGYSTREDYALYEYRFVTYEDVFTSEIKYFEIEENSERLFIRNPLGISYQEQYPCGMYIKKRCDEKVWRLYHVEPIYDCGTVTKKIWITVLVVLNFVN